MRRCFVPAIVLLFGLLQVGTAVLPAASASARQTPSPALDDPFLYVDAEGVERASITVSAVEDPFEDFAPGYEPEANARYVLLTVVFENVGPGPFETRPDQIALQDVAGFIWSSASIERGEDVTTPVLRSVEMAPGDRISGVVAFQIPDEAEPARVLYQPESSRMLVLANVQAAPSPAPEVGTENAYVDAESGAEGVITVTEVADPFENVAEGYEAEAGSRYLLLTVAVENTGSTLLAFNPNHLLVRDGAGYLWATATVRRPEDVVVPDLQSQDLAPGSRVTGVVGFQVPADAPVSEVLYQPISGRIIVLAELQGSDGATDVDTAPGTTRADCEGIEEWSADTGERLDQAAELVQEAAQIPDPARLEEIAQEFADLAAEQGDMDVPGAAAELNDALEEILLSFEQALTRIVTAAEEGDDVELALVEGVNAFNDAGGQLLEVITQADELAATCGD
jgi:hypothetical protein